MSDKIIHLTERITFTQPPRVDDEKSIAYGIKLLGWDSKNGRKYIREGCGRCADKYKGAKVNIDHGNKAFASRFGSVVEAYDRDDGLYGDVLFNAEHAHAKAFKWFLKNDPNAAGMSHDADGRVTQNADGSMTIHEIVKVNSVDIVGDPATTKGFLESMDPMNPTAGGSAVGDFKAQLGELAKQLFTSEEFDVKDVKARMKHLLNLLNEDSKGKDEPDEKPGVDAGTQESVNKELATLKAQLDTYRVKEQLDNQKVLAVKLCKAVQLPAVAMTEYFLTDLASKPNEASMREAIEDRRKVLNLTGSTKPRAPGTDTAKPTVDDFCKQLLTESN